MQKLASELRKLWKNDVVRTICTLALIPIIIIGCWFALPKALNTDDIFPLFVVVSGSMCIPKEECNTGSLFSHTFERSLHVGDLLIIKGVDAKDLKTDYPNSDIIVFRDPAKAKDHPRANIVHRIIDKVEVDGKLYFHTKGDGNNYPNVWPQEPQPNNRDQWHSTTDDPISTYDGAISEDYIYGKVAMRVPWIGAIAMQSQKSRIIPSIFVIVIVFLIVFEFILPLIKKRSIQSKETTTDTIKGGSNNLLVDQSNNYN